MGKLDTLRRTAGAHVTESASRREVETAAASMPTLATPNPARMPGLPRSKNAFEIPVDQIEPDPAQPREDFDDESLGRLAESMKARGQLQPIRVRRDDGKDAYVIVAGERRWRAAKMIELATVSCEVSDAPAEPAELLADQLVENLLREDLRPIEQAKGFRALMELRAWSGNQLAKELGIAQSSVVHALALLELPATIQELVKQGTLTPSAAYELSKLSTGEEQEEVAALVVTGGLNRAETVDAVKCRNTGSRAKSKRKGRGARGGPFRLRLADLGLDVMVKRFKGKGRMVSMLEIHTALQRALAELPAEADAAA
jgi:ParB family chromosome partitioning protein